MQGKAAMKVPGGKLLKVWVEYDGATIIKAKFTGDFFVHPEDAVENAEEKLSGARKRDAEAILERGLSNARMYGVDVKSMAKVLGEAVK